MPSQCHWTPWHSVSHQTLPIRNLDKVLTCISATRNRDPPIFGLPRVGDHRVAHLLRRALKSLSHLLYLQFDPVLAPWIQPSPASSFSSQGPQFPGLQHPGRGDLFTAPAGTPTRGPHKALSQELLTQVSACQSDEVAEREDTH